MDAPDPNPSKRRRWLRFSLRSLLIATTLVGSLLGWVTFEIRRGRAIEQAIIEVNLEGFTYKSPVPEWMRPALGEYFLATVAGGTGWVDGVPVYLGDVCKLTIEELAFTNLRLSDAQFAQLEGMKSLEEIYLHNVEISDAALEHLAGITGLKCLMLIETTIGDAGVKHVEILKNLDALHLSKANVTDSGMAHLQNMTNLTSLSLAGTQISDAGLANISGLKKLVRLSLAQTSVTDAGLAHLYGLTNLEYLSLLDTSATTAGVRKLRRALPNCEIILTGHEPRK